MKSLIYKQKHTGDPSPETGVFGCDNCMGHIRAWAFDATIGVGGIGAEAEQNSLKAKLTWIGVGVLKTGDPCKPLVTFDKFLHLGERGPSLRVIAPALAKRMYDRNTRATTDAHFSPYERREIATILEMAKASGPSPARLDTEKRSGGQTGKGMENECQPPAGGDGKPAPQP